MYLDEVIVECYLKDFRCNGVVGFGGLSYRVVDDGFYLGIVVMIEFYFEFSVSGSWGDWIYGKGDGYEDC